MANVGSQEPVTEVQSEAAWLEKSLPWLQKSPSAMLWIKFDKVAQLLVFSYGNRALSSQHLAAADSLATKTLQLRTAHFHHTDITFPDSCTPASNPQSLLEDEKRMFVQVHMGEVEANPTHTHTF